MLQLDVDGGGSGGGAFSILLLDFIGKFRIRGLKVLFYIYLSVRHYFRG